jgi:hypothetical protein
MNEDELRALVRRAVAERLALQPPASAAPVLHPRDHASHGRLRMAPSVERGQPCVIEPHVGCSLCGYCQSMGH